MSLRLLLRYLCKMRGELFILLMSRSVSLFTFPRVRPWAVCHLAGGIRSLCNHLGSMCFKASICRSSSLMVLPSGSLFFLCCSLSMRCNCSNVQSLNSRCHRLQLRENRGAVNLTMQRCASSKNWKLRSGALSRTFLCIWIGSSGISCARGFRMWPFMIGCSF